MGHPVAGCDIVVSVVLQLWLLSGVLLQSAGQQPALRNCTNERNVCYEFYHQAKSRTDADDFCRGRNGRLATILDIQTQQYIQSMLDDKSVSGYRYWIGGTLDMMHQWTWVNGKSYSGTVISMCHTSYCLSSSLPTFIFLSSLD